MMRILDSYARPSLPPCRGVQYILSCGFDPSTAPAGGLPERLAPIMGNWGDYSMCPTGIVTNSTKVLIVLVVLISMPVLNVTGLTLPLAAIFVAPRGPPTHSPGLPSPLLPTPVKGKHLLFLLSGYTTSIAKFLFSGFTEGFPLHYEGYRDSFQAPNLLSAVQHPSAVDHKIAKELASHRLAGPFLFPPFPVFRISPVGLVPKKTPGEFRLIHHLSFPKGSSLNDGISSEHTSVSYATVQDAIRLIRATGPGCFLAKTDIQNAFRILPIRPADYPLLGICWRGYFYYDRCMPMGCASSCRTFETFSTAIEWIARNRLHITGILHLLDDFLIIAPSRQLCQQQLDLFLTLCSYLGIPMAPEKTIGPATTLAFAGIELYSIEMEARLPPDKLAKCSQLISLFLLRKKVTLHDIQVLTGLLNFACSVIVPGRAFLRRLIDLTMGIKAPYHKIRLSKEVKEDLRVWQEFLFTYNGRSFFLSDNWASSNTLQLYTDASGALGFGAIFGRHWCYGKWPLSWVHLNIAILEFYPIVLSLYLWGSEMRNSSILFFTDNEALVHVINKQSCRDKSLMFFVRKLVLVCLSYNIVFKAKHIPGLHNKLADSLSRLQVQTFKQLAPAHMNPSPTEIPRHLQPLNWQP